MARNIPILNTSRAWTMLLKQHSGVVYKKSKRKNVRKILRFAGLGIFLLGLSVGMYVLFPLISWELYLKPAFASQSFASPIPQTTIITKDYIKSLFENTASSFRNVDYSNAHNWLPSTYKEVQVTTQLSSYFISIPKFEINNAFVSTVDTDLDTHLINFPGTAVPPAKGNAVIFGHSTLPQLYNPKDYKTIFANIHETGIGDTILVTAKNTLYTYKVFDISIVSPQETSYLTQQYDNSYITIVTCTPPGTTWKRLIIKAKLEKI